MENQNQNRGALAGVRIVEIGESRTIKVAGMLLAKYGADVLSFSDEKTEQQSVMLAGKTILPIRNNNTDISSLHSVVSNADVFLHDYKKADLEKLGIDTAKIRSDIKPDLIECAVCGYAGDRSDSQSYWSEQCISADSGLFEDPRGIGKPFYYSLPIASTVAALYCVNAVVMALITRKRSGIGQYIEVPIQKAALSAQIFGIIIKSNPPVHWNPLQWLATPFSGIWKTWGDRYIFVQLVLPKHLRSFMRLIEKQGFKVEALRLKKIIHKSTKNSPTTVHSPNEAKAIILIFKNLFLKKDADYWEELFSKAELCCAKIRTTEEWFTHQQPLGSKEILSDNNSSGSPVRSVGSLLDSEYTLEALRGKSGERNTLQHVIESWNSQNSNTTEVLAAETVNCPLQGKKVLDFSRVIAGPYSGKILAEYGAEVVQITFRNNHLIWEEPFYIAFSCGKKSVYVNISSPEGKTALQLFIKAFKPDIVIHNFGENTVRKLGIDYGTFTAINPSVVYLQIGAYNENGPWGNRTGFEQNIQAATGIQASYSGASEPKLLPVPIIDICTGLLAAFSASLGYYQTLSAHKSNAIKVFLSAPSLLLQLEQLNQPSILEPQLKDLCGYFKAIDCTLFLHVKKPYIENLSKIPVFCRLKSTDIKDHPAYLQLVIKQLTFETFQVLIPMAKCERTVFIVKRRKIKQLLKDELNKFDGLFEHKFFNGFGNALASRPSVYFEKTPLQYLETAPVIGSNTIEVFKRYGISVPKASIVKPTILKMNVLRDRIQRVFWVLRQLKWIRVYLYKEKLYKDTP